MSSSKITQKNEIPDFMSQLPVPIIHYILSLLNNNKDCARTCVLSKTWKNLFYSRTHMVFNEEDFMPSSDFYINSLEGRRLFLEYVEQSLNHCIEMKSNHLEKFEFHLALCDPEAIPQSDDVNHLLQKVFGLGVKTMSLMLDSLDNLENLVLDSKTVVQLHLDCFCFIKACKTINFPYLKFLSLFHVDLQNGALEKLIFGCPRVQVLRLSHCSTSQNLQLSGLARLEELTLSFCRDVETVEIGSQFFQTLFLIDEYSDSTSTTLLGCETMRKLQLNMRLSNDLSSFKWLSELKLMSLVINGRISSQSIRRLVIRLCRAETEMVVIDCPNLLSLEYKANHMPFQFVSVCHDLRDFRYEFSLLQNGRSEQMDALKKLFGSTFSATKNLKVVIVLGHLKDVIILDGLTEVMLSVLNKIGDLLEPRIFVTSDSIDWNAILPIVYPRINLLAVNVVSLCGSTFSKDVLKKFLSLIESQTGKYANVCCVKMDYRKKNIPIELQAHQGSQYQLSRIILKFDWSKQL